MVAATWSALEFDVLASLSEVGKVDLVPSVILAAPSSVDSWLNMHNTFTKGKHIEKEIAILTRLVMKLKTLRNYIIHATWKSDNNSGIISSVMNQVIINASYKAKGLGIPKRGRDVIVSVEWNSTQIRKVASLIEESQQLLYSIVHRRPPTSPQERVADSIVGQTNLRRIQKMLDMLPDPFHQSHKKKVSP